MAEPLPGSLDRAHHADLSGRSLEVWIRRAGLTLFCAFLLAALLGVFGQSPRSSSAAGPRGSLALEAPERLRGGLVFQARMTVRAVEAIKDPQIVLGGGWVDGVTLNTVEPSPAAERSVDDRLTFRLMPVAAGRSTTLWLEFQVNPTSIGSRDQDVELRDGDEPIAHIDRTIRIFP